MDGHGFKYLSLDLHHSLYSHAPLYLVFTFTLRLPPFPAIIGRDNHRHIFRDRQLCTTACPACWAMGTIEVKYCTARKNYFVLCLLEQPRQDENLLYRHDEPYEVLYLFHFYSLRPHLSQLQQSAGAIPQYSL
jgi:hypothetical protein